MARFANGQPVWVRLPLEMGLYYEFVGFVLRALPAERPGGPQRYEVQGPVQERYTVEEGWMSLQRPAEPPGPRGSQPFGAW